MAADVGQAAPDFTLPSDSWDNKVSLEETRREEPVVLFSTLGLGRACAQARWAICSRRSSASRRRARGLAVSADSPWSHRAWAEERGSDFPLLSDFQRKVVDKRRRKARSWLPRTGILRR